MKAEGSSLVEPSLGNGLGLLTAKVQYTISLAGRFDGKNETFRSYLRRVNDAKKTLHTTNETLLEVLSVFLAAPHKDLLADMMEPKDITYSEAVEKLPNRIDGERVFVSRADTWAGVDEGFKPHSSSSFYISKFNRL